MVIICCKCEKGFLQDLAVDVNAYAITDHLLMVTVVIALGHIQEVTNYPTHFLPIKSEVSLVDFLRRYNMTVFLLMEFNNHVYQQQ